MGIHIIEIHSTPDLPGHTRRVVHPARFVPPFAEGEGSRRWILTWGGVGVIKGAGTANGRPMLILGLSGENVARLAAGEPIRVSAGELAGMGLPAVEVLIVYGKTEDAIVADLRGSGLAGAAEAPVVHRECTSPTCDHPDHPRGVRRGLR